MEKNKEQTSRYVIGPDIQFLGAEGDYHLLKISYQYRDTTTGKMKVFRGAILKIKPENLYMVAEAGVIPMFEVNVTREFLKDDLEDVQLIIDSVEEKRKSSKKEMKNEKEKI